MCLCTGEGSAGGRASNQERSQGTLLAEYNGIPLATFPAVYVYTLLTNRP